MKTCTACNGSGHYDRLDKNGNGIKCDNCNGTGNVKGCEYCESEKPLKTGIVINYEIDIVNNSYGEKSLRLSSGNVEESKPINYCPMCGNKLIND